MVDSLDLAIIRLLSQNGRMPTGEMARQLEVTNPTVRSRLKTLVSSGVLKVAALVDFFKIEKLAVALVALKVEKHQELDAKIEEISQLDQVHWAAVISGRYDIIVEVISSHGMAGLYQFLTVDLPKVGGIQSSESFIVMKAKKKWILLSEEM
jgi:Lrp/AsnC family transcriptional regulator for asnA, asnC and gidA